MRIIYLLFFTSLTSVLALWLGKYNKSYRNAAVYYTASCIVGTGIFLGAAVLPYGSFFGRVVTSADVDEKVIALTFDDGPYPPYTETLLKALQKENTPATFFMVAHNARNNPQTVQAIRKAGHEIGLHAESHRDFLKLGGEELRQNIAAAKTTLERLSGSKISIARPPHGFKDWLVQEKLAEAGLTTINWSVSPRDWTEPGIAVIVEKVCGNAAPGAIVLLHDGDSPKNAGSRSQTVAAVPEIIKRLKENGYRFVTVSELLALEKQKHETDSRIR